MTSLTSAEAVRKHRIAVGDIHHLGDIAGLKEDLQFKDLAELKHHAFLKRLFETMKLSGDGVLADGQRRE